MTQFKGIDVEVIPHSAQRYPTCGDWQWETVSEYDPQTGEYKDLGSEKLMVNISDTGNNWSNLLVAIHEIVEAVLCKWANISEKEVDDWDMSHLDSDDPGSLEGCPYYLQHTIATSIEVILCCALFMSWSEHCRRIESLDSETEIPVEPYDGGKLKDARNDLDHTF
jgi:hypothetical protein